MKQVLLYNLIGCIHLEKDINQWVFPLWRHKGLFHRRGGINKLVQGALYELSYTVHFRGEKIVGVFFSFFLPCGFWQCKTKQSVFSYKNEEFFYILKTYLKTPPHVFVDRCRCCSALILLEVLPQCGSLPCLVCAGDNFRAGAATSCFETKGHCQLETRKKRNSEHFKQ